ncbi:MAG: TrgA family protein [Aestuariivita sp.]|uniref:TrgA family protein n=1 Tax=Aestuariivita sp. TaxID=1872407 RepID=UPI003BB15738
MPNASSLFAAIFLAVIAFVVSGQIIPLFPEGKDFGLFTPLNMALGLVIGWKTMGPRAGRGMTAGITNGITGTALLVFWGLFVQGCYEMVRLAMRNRYDGPFEAIIAIFEIGYEFAVMMAQPNILLTLFIGAVVAGALTEHISRIWR